MRLSHHSLVLFTTILPFSAFALVAALTFPHKQSSLSIASVSTPPSNERNTFRIINTVRVAHHVPPREGDPLGVEVLESKQELELADVADSTKDDKTVSSIEFGSLLLNTTPTHTGSSKSCDGKGKCNQYICGWECEPVLLAVVAECKVEKKAVVKCGSYEVPWRKDCHSKRTQKSSMSWKRCSKEGRFEKCVPLVRYSRTGLNDMKNMCEGRPLTRHCAWEESRIVRHRRPPPTRLRFFGG